MTNTLTTPQLDSVLTRLLAAADADNDVPPPPPGLASWAMASASERAEAYRDVYIPISPEAGQLLYALVRSGRPDTVVEFGTSFGISTIYLAAAVTDNGTGHVITTEI